MDYVQEDGHVIPNNLLTEDAEVPISYAYCSDNRVKENQLDFLQNTNYLYHEATFTQELLDNFQGNNSQIQKLEFSYWFREFNKYK